ncbi:MAG TPA: triacylglycerol lipase, partial [Clostridiales bacterium]|nr:triacylglycerol lipase [Clostridiales bacterium]
MQNRLKYLFVLASSLLASNYYALSEWLGFPFRAELFVLLTAVFCMANILLPAKHALSKRLALLESGSRLLKVFLCFLAVQIVFTVCFGLTAETGALIVQILTAVLFGGLLFWNGMLRVYLCSAQLGVKWRVIGALCGWIPLLNLWALHKIITIASGEAAVELEKLSLQAIRAESELCHTKYPLLLVHGVFFRDSRLVNYWGRIPAYLRR